MINERRVFAKVLKDWGHDILYQRRISDDFVYCDILERITTRSMVARNATLAMGLQEGAEGYYVNSEYIYYFEHNVNPKSGDRIYEESFDSLEDARIMVVDDCYPYRGRGGKVSYWIVGATKEKPS